MCKNNVLKPITGQAATGQAATGLEALAPAELALTVQNLSPLRQGLDLGPGWQLLGRIDGCDQPLLQSPGQRLDQLLDRTVNQGPGPGAEAAQAPGPGAEAQGPETWDLLTEAAVVGPWQLASYRIRRLA